MRRLKKTLLFGFIILNIIALNSFNYFKFSILPLYLIENNFKNQYSPELSTKAVKIVSNNPYSDYDPVIAIDSADINHIVWSGYDYGAGSYHIMYTNSSDNYANIKKISNISTHNYDPCIAIDHMNVVHIAWEGSDKIYYTNSSVNYSNYTLISKQNYAWYPQIICDSLDIVHIVWMGNNASNWDIFYANSTDLFTNNMKISNNSLYDKYPDLCASGGIIHIVWSQEMTNHYYKIAYANSSDNFISEKIISQGQESQWNPKIAPDNIGNVHIVWYGKKYDTDLSDFSDLLIMFILYIYLPYFNDDPFVPSRFLFPYSSSTNYPDYYFFSPYFFNYDYKYLIYYSNSNDNFQIQREISTPVSIEAYNPDIIVDSENICHIIWRGDSNSYYYNFGSYLFYTNSSQNFQNFKSYSLNSYTAHPRIANDTGNGIHCVFESYSSSYNNYEIYYSKINDFQNLTITENIGWYFIQLYTAIPKMPDTSILTFLVLTILGGFNFISIIVFFRKKQEISPEKQEHKKRDENKIKKSRNKIIIEKNGKKISVKIP